MRCDLLSKELYRFIPGAHLTEASERPEKMLAESRESDILWKYVLGPGMPGLEDLSRVAFDLIGQGSMALEHEFYRFIIVDVILERVKTAIP